MHPIVRSRARLGTYLLGWTPIAGILVFVGLSERWTLVESVCFALPQTFLGAFLFLSSWYLCKAYPLRNLRLPRFALAWALAALAMAHLWVASGWILARGLVRAPGLHHLYAKVLPATPLLLGMGALLYLITLALHYLLESIERNLRSEAKEDELRILAQDAELRALRAQLNPHFLFNSLNSISALTTLDPQRARSMCILLSDFLRGTLKLGEKRNVALSEEVDLIKAYLSIEQIRFGSRLQVAWEIAPEVTAEPVPALLLQPLVENAIKHGIAGLTEGGVVRISARVEKGTLELKVENPVDPDMPQPEGLGIGLRQVRSRLALRFGTRMGFEAGIVNDVHRVTMIFPTTQPGADEVSA